MFDVGDCIIGVVRRIASRFFSGRMCLAWTAFLGGFLCNLALFPAVLGLYSI